MKLRPYQAAGVAAALDELTRVRSTLLVMPTATGKTVVMGHIAKARHPRGRALIVAHTEELIEQAANKLRRITNAGVDYEQGGRWADESAFSDWQAPTIVATIQSLRSAYRDGRRIDRFDPMQFSTVFRDEAHRAVSASDRLVFEHFSRNPNCGFVGVTATPDRADEQALGQVYESVAMNYEISDALHDGWIVPVLANTVIVEGLTFAHIGTVAGELNGGELATEMERDEPLHRIASSTFEIAAGRRTLLFCASVKQAAKTCDILNRHKASCARFVSGKTDKQERSETVRAFARGDFQFLVNCQVYTEGFDDPGIEVVALAHPTKSRGRMCQMVGRGFRVLPGIVDDLIEGESQALLGIEDGITDMATLRKSRIAASRKPMVEVIDFTGVTGQHKLASPIDVLGGKYSDEVLDLARIESRKPGAKPVDELIEEAKQKLEEKRLAEIANRAKIVGKATFSKQIVDLFDKHDLGIYREPEWGRKERPTKAQMTKLEGQCKRMKIAIPDFENMSKGQVSACINALAEKAKTMPAASGQIWFLTTKRGWSRAAASKLTMAQATEILAGRQTS